MKYSNTIEYNISTKLDSSGLTKLQAQIKQLENSMQQMSNRELLHPDKVQAAKTQLEGLNKALTNSFNSSLGILDLSKFRAELDSSGVSAQGLQSAFNMMGAEGQAALNGLTTQIANFNGGMERTSSAVDKIFTTFSNTFRWGLISSFFSNFMNSIHQSVDYVKELDDSLTQIMLVTDYNRDSMNQYAKSANEAAKALSMSTTGMTNASLIFAQQGYNLEQSQDLATLSAKLANASQQETAATSDQITAYMNAYGLQNDMAALKEAMDNWAMIANISAADVDELAEASQKAASMANAVGVSGEALAAQIATIEDATREAPEQIGNGLKTLYARFSDLTLGGEDEEGVGLGKVTSVLNSIGVKVLDELGNVRSMDLIIEDLMDVWADLDQTAQLAAAQALAGKYQVNRFVALMDNRDSYEKYVEATGKNASGTLDVMNQEYAESLAGRSQKLQTSLEGLFSTIFDTDDIYPWIDAAQGAVDLLQEFFDALGGGKTILLGLTTVVGQLFNQNLARNINNVLENRRLGEIRKNNIEGVGETLDRVGIDRTQGVGKYITDMADKAKLGALSDAQYDAYLTDVDQLMKASTALAESEEQLQATIDAVNLAYGKSLKTKDAVFPDPELSGLNTQFGIEAKEELDLKQIDRLTRQTDFKDAIAAAKTYSAALQEVERMFVKFDSETGKTRENLNQVTDAISLAKQNLKTLFDAGLIGTDSFEKMDEALTKLENDANNFSTDTAEQEIEQLIKRIASFAQTAEKLTPEELKRIILGGLDRVQSEKNTVDFNQTQVDRAKQNIETRSKGIDNQQQIKAVLDTFNAVQRLTFAWQGFQNLGNLITDDSLDNLDKATQIISNLAMTFPQLFLMVSQGTDKFANFSGKIENASKQLQQQTKDWQTARQEIRNLAEQQSSQQIQQQTLFVDRNRAISRQTQMDASVEEWEQRENNLKEQIANLVQERDEYLENNVGRKKKNEYKHTVNNYARQEFELEKELSHAAEQTAKAKEDAAKAAKEVATISQQQEQLDKAIQATEEAQTVATRKEKAAKEAVAATDKEIFALQIKQLAMSMAISLAFAAIATGIAAIRAEEEKRVQAITDAAEKSRTNLDAIEKSSFFEQWDTFKENGELTDELKESMAALAQQMGINIEAQDIYDGNIEELNNKLRDNIELEKERARTSFEAENDEFENQLNKNSIKATQIGTTVTTASGTFNSAVDYVKQAGEVKTLAERLGEVADAQDAVSAARKNFGRDSLEYKKALNEYQELSDQLKNNDKVDVEKAKSNFRELADLAVEEFKAENANKALTKDDWLNFINAEESNGIAIREYMTTLGSNVAKEYLDSLLAGLEEGKDSVSQLLQDIMNPEVSVDALTSAKETKDPLEELYSKYDKNKGSFSEDEVADILKDHAEYIEYLDKEGEHYVLNRRFLEDYNQAVRDQKQAMDELQGDSFDLRDNQDFLNDKLNNEEDPNQAIYQKLAEANYGMMQGELTSDNFLDTTNEALSDLVDRLAKIPEYGEAAAKGMDAFAEALNELDADAIGAVFDELYGGLKQSAKQFKSGQKTVGQYGEDLLQATETAIDFAEVTGDTRSVEKFQDILDDGAEGAIEFSNAITDNYDQVTQVFDDSFNVLDSAMSATGGISEQYRGLIETMVASSANFYTQNQEAATAMATSLYADLGNIGYSVNDLRTLLQTGSAELAGALMNDASAAETMMRGTASQTQAAISQMASGISSLISGTMQMIASVSGNINGEPEITAGKTVDVDAVDSTGNKSKISMHIPGFNMVIKGNGSSGSGGTGGKTSWSPSANNGSGGFVTKFSRDMTASGHAETRAATTEEIISSGALSDWSNQVSEDLAGGITGLVSLKQYAPPTSTSGGIPTRPSSGGGGGGKSCFVAGTQITTQNGFKNIEDINIGDIVLSYNEKTQINEYSQVLQTMIHSTIESIYTLYIEEEQLRVTGIHKFFIKRNNTIQWIEAQNLQLGDEVFFSNNTWHLILDIDVKIEIQTVYNFEVSHNHNYYVGHNQILAHNKGGGKGGKGGGGKAKTIEPKEKKEHEKDYYEEVSNQLEKTEKILSRIEKEEDRLIGDKARANQNKQLSNLAKEIELQKEKQKIQQQELKDVDALLAKREKEARQLAVKNGVDFNIPSPVYDEDGIISNYEQISAAIDKIHNQLIDKYNTAAKAGNEDLTKEIQKTIEKFDKYGEEILKNAQRHNKLQSEIEETNNALEELADAMEDIRIEAWKAHQEAIDNLKDLKEDAAELASLFRDIDPGSFTERWSLDDTPINDMIEAMYKLDNIYAVSKEDANDFYQNLINQKQKALANTKDADEKEAIQSAINYFKEQQAGLSEDNLSNGLLGLALQDVDKLKGWIDGTNKEANPFGKNEAALWEAYEDAYKRAKDLTEDWRKTVKDLRDSIIDAYDEQDDAIGRNIDNYDRLLDKLERMSDTYQLYYGEDSYDGILQIMNQQANTMQQELNSLTAAFNYWQNEYQKALETGDEKFIQSIEDKMNDAEDKMLDKAEELAELFVEKYEKAVDASISKTTESLWGKTSIARNPDTGEWDLSTLTLNLEDQTAMWELQKDYMSTYKDDVEKSFEIDKLRSKYLDLLNDAQGMSSQTQDKIRAQMQEQLQYLQDQTTMSEYDVKLANAKLEILQKQIALEDAQRNKNKMRLRRDTQGNYRYVYTADQGKVKEAQEELNESEFDAYEITKNQTIENNDRAINLYNDFMNKMRDISNKYKDDEAGGVAAMAAFSQEYSKLLEALGEDFKDTTNGLYDVLTWLVENGTQNATEAATSMLDQLYDKNGEVKENTGNDWRDLATEITEDILPNVETAVGELLDNISIESDELKEKLVGDNGTLKVIKSAEDDLTNGLNDIVEATNKWAQANTALFDSFFQDEKLENAKQQLVEMEKQLQANQSATSTLSTKLTQANADLQAQKAETLHYKTALDFKTGTKKVTTGTVVKLKKGTVVHYDRYGGIQKDDKGKTSWALPKDTWVKFGEIDNSASHPYSFYATGDSAKDATYNRDANWKGKTSDWKKSDSSGGVDIAENRHHQNWWFNQSELQKNVLDSMDTGGYTGEWNESTNQYKNGKLALLHQKELVLNEKDTENILNAVQLMRDITAGTLTSFKQVFSTMKAQSSYNPITEQRVEIQATFPNATDADDIRNALIGLSDKAYQYAHRAF